MILLLQVICVHIFSENILRFRSYWVERTFCTYCGLTVISLSMSFIFSSSAWHLRIWKFSKTSIEISTLKKTTRHPQKVKRINSWKLWKDRIQYIITYVFFCDPQLSMFCSVLKRIQLPLHPTGATLLHCCIFRGYHGNWPYHLSDWWWQRFPRLLSTYNQW